MNFTEKFDSHFFEGVTKKGNKMFYVRISEDKLVYLIKKHKQLYTNDITPTRLVLYCNFQVPTALLDELKKYQLVEIEKVCNNHSQIIMYPLILFNYSKFQNILTELTQKFDL